MTMHGKISASKVSLLDIFPEGTKSFQQIIECVASDEELSDTQKRDWTSALKRICAALNMAPENTPVDPRWLRNKLKVVSATGLGITKKTWSNVLSDAKSAIVRYGVRGSADSGRGLQEPWQSLWDGVRDLHLRCNLTRFVTYCSRKGIAPEGVTDQVVVDFMNAFASLRKDPALAYYHVTKCWNEASSTIAGWPASKLEVPSRRKVFKASDDELLPSLLKDVQRYFALSDGSDILADGGPPKPFRPASIVQYRKQLLRVFGELLHKGVPASDLRTLTDVVQPFRVELVLRSMIDRNGGRTSQNIFMTAYQLRNIAKHYCRLGEAEVRKLSEMCSKLSVKYRGMTPKNFARLGQFDDPVNVGRILRLSEDLVAEAKLKKTAAEAARLVEVALAIELLISTAIRAKNLAGLHLERNLHWNRAVVKGGCHLVLLPDEVKNEEYIELELPTRTVSLLREFVREHRPLLAPAKSPWLFSQRNEIRSVSPITLSGRIKRAVFDRTGLAVNAHLFRALTGKLYLDENPGGYEVVRRMLAHKSVSTTISAYTGAETKSAAKHFDETLRRLRDNSPGTRSTWRKASKRKQENAAKPSPKRAQ